MFAQVRTNEYLNYNLHLSSAKCLHDSSFACSNAHITPYKVKQTNSWEHEINDQGKGCKTEVEIILTHFHRNEYFLTIINKNNNTFFLNSWVCVGYPSL